MSIFIEDAQRAQRERDAQADVTRGEINPAALREAERELAACARRAASVLERRRAPDAEVLHWLDVARAAAQRAAQTAGQCLPCEGMGQVCRLCESIPCLCTKGPFQGLSVCPVCLGSGMKTGGGR